MATTKITANSLADGAAQANLNAGASISLTKNIIANGTSNRLPNQTANTSDDIITKSLSDFRHSNSNKRITDDVTFIQNTWEQFIDFDDQYNTDLVVANAFGASSFQVSPVFAEIWNASNAGVVSFVGNDQYTHRGIFLIRGATSSNQVCVIGFNRPTHPYVLSSSVYEFTCRMFINSPDFTTQGYLKIGPIAKGGSGGGDASLFGGIMFNPYLHATNLVLGVGKTGVASPYTFTTNSANVDFLDTGFNIINLFDRWINITYKVDLSVAGTTLITILIVRDNVTLFSQTYNVGTDPVISTWARNFNLSTVGASREIGLQYGKFTYTTRSQIFFDYFYYKTTGISSAPSNWNSLRF